jgi:hypothetical protein
MFGTPLQLSSQCDSVKQIVRGLGGPTMQSSGDTSFDAIDSSVISALDMPNITSTNNMHMYRDIFRVMQPLPKCKTIANGAPKYHSFLIIID